MTVAGGRVVSRPMNGAIEGMLAVLEDPRAEQADAAVAGLVERYYREGPDALRPFKPRFRKMLARPRSRRAPRGRLGAGPHRRHGHRPAADRRAHRPRRGRRRRRAAGPADDQPQDRRPGTAQPVDPRTAQGGRRPLARVVQRDQAARPRRRRGRRGRRPASGSPARRRASADPCARDANGSRAMARVRAPGRRRHPAGTTAREPSPSARRRSAASRSTTGSRRS